LPTIDWRTFNKFCHIMDFVNGERGFIFNFKTSFKRK
jgi:hypothetical protein